MYYTYISFFFLRIGLQTVKIFSFPVHQGKDWHIGTDKTTANIGTTFLYGDNVSC